MKVLHIIGNAGFGGIERLVITLVNQQLAGGKVIPGIMFSSMEGEFLDKFEQTGARLMSSNCRHAYDVSPGKFRSILEMFAGFDVLHFHYFNPFIAWCAVRSGKRIVYTEHGNFGFGRKATVSDKLKSKLKKAFLNNNVHHITFNSSFTRRVAEKRFDLSRVSRSTLYNGVAVSDVRGTPQGVVLDVSRRIANRFVVGTTSRFAGFKRIDRLIEAFALVQRERPDMVLLLVGDGATRSSLEDTVSRLGIGEKVVFAGYRSNVYDYQSAMDVCVFPSVDEPFGLVAVETLLLGKPTLVFSDGGGLREIVGGVSEQDVVEGIDALCARIDFYYRHPEVRESRKGDFIEYARGFDAETMGDAFCDIYENLAPCAA